MVVSSEGGVVVWSGGRGARPPKLATAAVGRHPIGIHSCFALVRSKNQ